MPTVKLTPNGGEGSITEGEVKAKISTKIEAEDNESGLNEIEYAWSQSNTEEPSNWTTFTNGNSVTVKRLTAGTYTVKATESVGGKSTSYTIEVTELKSLAPTLGSAYKVDSNNINSGYPILT